MNNYKEIISNRAIRLKILKMLSWLPDKTMVQIQYRIKTGRPLNLKDPKRYTEKLQWMKLFYRNELMRKCADKVTVREYVRSCGLSKLLVPIIGIYKNSQEINFVQLPDTFVIKDSLGSGGNEIILCLRKEQFDIEAALKTINIWTKKEKNYKHPGREWVYENPERSQIIVESYIESKKNDTLTEFKFFCFDGEPQYLYVLTNRVLGEGVELGIFTVDPFKQINVWRADEKRLRTPINKPKCYFDMVKAAKKLAEPFPHARIDFFLASDTEFYFSEITFFDGSGYFLYDPDEFDFEMGQHFQLPKENYHECS